MGGTVTSETIDEYPTIASTIANFSSKQDKIIGTKDQLVSFDDDGNMIAVDVSGINIGGGSGDGGDETTTVTSVNGHTGDVTLTADDVGAPTTSAFTNHTSDTTAHMTSDEKTSMNNAVRINYSDIVQPLRSDYGTPICSFCNNDTLFFISTNGCISSTTNGKDFLAPQYLPLGQWSNRWWHDIAYGNGRYIIITGNDDDVFTSADGKTWERISGALPYASGWRFIEYGNGVFIATGISSSNKAIYAVSTDGITWSGSTLQAAVGNRGLAFGNGIFVAAFSNSSSAVAIYTSYNGNSWTKASFTFNESSGYGVLSPIRFGNGVFSAITLINGYVMPFKSIYSQDGSTWSMSDLSYRIGSDDAIYYPDLFAFVGDRFMVVPHYGSTGIYSLDGITWSDFSLPLQYWGCLAYFNYEYYLTKYNSTTLFKSQDGLNWSCETPSGIQNLSGSDLSSDLRKITAPNVQIVKLAAADWSFSNSQTVTVQGVSGREDTQLIHVCPSTFSMSSYYDAGVICASQEENSLTFTTKKIPTEDLSIYIAIQPFS